MASVTGSRLAFFSPTSGQSVNVVLTNNGATDLNGNALAGDAISGNLNLEVFTASPGGGFSLAPGYQASAFVQGATVVAGTSNEVQAAAGAAQQFLDGTYTAIALEPDQAETVVGSAGGSNDTVVAAGGNTIVGSTNPNVSQLIDSTDINSGSPGPDSIVGGAGPTTVWSSVGDSITGSSGPMSVSGAITPGSGIFANNVLVTGGSGNMSVFDMGTGNTITGGSGTTFIDDSYGAGNTNTLVGGSGTGPVTNPLGGSDSAAGGAGSWLVGGPKDMIMAGAGTMLAQAGAGDTVVAGAANSTVRGSINDSVVGGSGTMQYNQGSGSSVNGGGGNLNAWAFGSGNTIGGGSNAAATTFIDDSYTAAGGAFVGGNNTIGGGAGSSELVAGPGDTLMGGTGSLTAFFKSGLNANETVNLSTVSGRGSATLTDLDTRSGVESLPGSAGTNVTVNNFSTSVDSVASAGSVVPGGGTGPSALTGTATAVSSNGGTLITFNDNSTMFLAGVSPTAIKFIQ